MATTTVKTQIIVQFDDQFTAAANLALEQYINTFEEVQQRIEELQTVQEFSISVELLDNATAQAKAIRAEIEGIFSKNITQRITIIEETIQVSTSSGFSKSGSSDFIPTNFDVGIPDFQTPSPDLTGFDDSVGHSFASGIDRVPRDMLAMIHKGEAVLPKNRAENYRRNGSSGMSIQNLNFSLNVPIGPKLDREEFRNLAFMMRDELKRLDRRMN